jgi:hypothetical protein
MKIENKIAKLIVVLVLLAVGILGAQIAIIVNAYNPLIARGILGLLIIYATYRNLLIPLANEPIQGLFLFPRDFKYFFYVFFFSLICYWAVQQIYYMIVGKI